MSFVVEKQDYSWWGHFDAKLPRGEGTQRKGREKEERRI
jgi:hypothetical protein